MPISVKQVKGFAVFCVTFGFLFVATFRSNVPDPQERFESVHEEQRTEENICLPLMRGKVNPDRKYAVFSSTSLENVGYMFLLPLTALAWKRIGFDSIVIIVGSPDVGKSDPLLQTVVTHLQKLGAVIIFLSNTAQENNFALSRVSRIFAANLLLRAKTANGSERSPDVIDDVYLITSDADLWPISGSIYNIPADVDVLSLNSFCCGTFKHGTQTYQMIPMANIGARVATWRNLTTRHDRFPSDASGVIECMTREDGDAVVRSSHKDDTVDWKFHQRLAGILVEEWKRRHGNSRVRLVPRDLTEDRIELSYWNPGESILNKVDARMVSDCFIGSEWNRLTALLTALHGNKSDNFKWSIDYYRAFANSFR